MGGCFPVVMYIEEIHAIGVVVGVVVVVVARRTLHSGEQALPKK